MGKTKTAWVITREGLEHPRSVVIGILSARKHEKTVKEYIEWLYMLLYCSPGTHLEFARYTKPVVACEAEFYKTNTGVSVAEGMRCGDTPWLEARLAKDVILTDMDDGPALLRWTNPDILVCDGPTVVGKRLGIRREAPVYLPLVTMPPNLLGR